MRLKDLLPQLLPLICCPPPKVESRPLQLGNQVVWARGPLLRPLLRTQGRCVLKQLHFLQPRSNASGPQPALPEPGRSHHALRRSLHA